MSAAQGPDGIRADGGGVRRDGYAAMAKEALDAHAPALLSRGGLALRARARMAAARAALRVPYGRLRTGFVGRCAGAAGGCGGVLRGAGCAREGG